VATNHNSFSRRAVVAGLAGLITSSITKAVASPDAGRPPLLQSTAAQFIELWPAVQPPPLMLERIDGRFVDLNMFRGKVVLMSFWATWCPPCHRELPLLETLQEIVDPRSLEIVAVSIDKEVRPAVEAFLKRVNVARLRPYLDPQGQIAKPFNEEAASPFVLYGMPISYVVDHRGRVAGYITGETDWTTDEGLALVRYYMGS
jgi:thiol-disulfide isomerase/thioredoxin